MSIKIHEIWSIISSPNSIRNYEMVDLFEMIEVAFATNIDCFNKFTKMLYSHYPLYLDIICRASKHSKYPYKELFTYHLSNYPESNDKKLTEASFSTLLKDLDGFFSDGKIIQQFYRKAIFDRALHYLSNDEYSVFRKMISQTLSDQVSMAIYEYVKAWDFSEYTFKHFVKIDSYKNLIQDPENVTLFENETNSEDIIFLKNKIDCFLSVGRTFFIYDIATQEKTDFLGDPDSILYKNLMEISKELERTINNKSINILYLVSGDNILGYFTDAKESKNIVLNPRLKNNYGVNIKGVNVKNLVEHIFYIELLKNKDNTVVFVNRNEKFTRIKTIYTDTLVKEESLKLKDISVVTIPMYNEQISIINGTNSETELIENIVCNTNDLKDLTFDEVEYEFKILNFRNRIKLFKEIV